MRLRSLDLALEAVELTATAPGTDGNNVTLTTTVSTNATETATASGANLSGGGDAASIGPGSLVSVLAQAPLSDSSASTPDSTQVYPTSLAGAEVYMDGVQAPLVSVSAAPDQRAGPLRVSRPHQQQRLRTDGAC